MHMEYPPILLDVKHLSTVFRGEKLQTKAVNDISFTLHSGETIGIVGESGSGKSVTALSIMGLAGSPEGLIIGGKILLYRDHGKCEDLLTLTKKQMRLIRGKEIAMVFQDPMTSLNPVFTCGMQVSEAIKQHMPVTREVAYRKTLEWFEEVKLPRVEEIYKSYPHQLSGGQKQRVMIAMAMSCQPKILIADEPTTALDVTVQKAILDLMKELQRRYSMGILFITHDLAIVRGFADQVIVMYKGRVVEKEETKILFSSPKHPYTKGLLKCRPPLSIRLKKLPTIEDFMVPDQNKKIDIETIEERKLEHEKIYSRSPILEIKQLETVFSSKPSLSIFKRNDHIVKAVDNVSLQVFPGETVGIVGESGCGKTTLGRTILQLVKSSSGSVLFEGKDLQSLSGKQLRKVRKDLQIIFQDPYSSLNPRIMVGTAIMEPMKVHGIYEDEKILESKARELLVRVGLEESMFTRYPHEFSGGQRQRICIARALAVNPKLIICDESVSALDVSIQAHILNLLNDLKREFGFTYVFISHDLSVVRFMSDRLIVMKDGRIVESGDSDKIYESPQSPYTQKLLEAIPRV
jgi:peptide/nickel transport system ATP-binding protein